MKAVRQRRPTIRRVRDWSAEFSRANLRLAPPPRDLLVTLPGESEMTRPYTDSESVRLVPKNSEVRGILVPRITDEADDEEHETLVWAPEEKKEEPESDDLKLDNLVSVFSKRAEVLEEERRVALEAAERAELKREHDRERRKWLTARRKRRHAAVKFLSEHRYKIIYSVICVWGLLQILFSR